MSQRLSAMQQSPEIFKKLVDFSLSAAKGTLETGLLHLIEIRASQINGCGFCVDMHVKQAKLHGEGEQRLHHLAIWRESPLFTSRERAALAWTEALTTLPAHGVADADYEAARAIFEEKELIQLTYNVMGINAWNRLNVAFRTEPGSADKAFGLDKAKFA
ncbi:carboxymuconolactone decarboxylase family protein [Variovorax sp. UC122_21]|uniref:carboxymuconolactone decarboxylase family protein n=1 Tax=Variovorax TaxID=34072 RepID=UPI001931B3B5|nr:carboxymuconolactone decarboxylase family protein [Variovorax paradoxus]